MNTKKTKKGYFYDIRTHRRISKKEYMRRTKISKSLKKTHIEKKKVTRKETLRRKRISKSLKKYWKKKKEEKKEIKPIEDVFEDIMEEFEIAEDDIQTGTP